MSLTELKLQIISRVTAINDELALEKILAFVDIESKASPRDFSDDERSAIEKGLLDLREGKSAPSNTSDQLS